MSTARHTPGPWTHAPAMTKAGHGIVQIVARGRRLLDMRVYDDEDRANAKLIAAAPALADALEELLADMDNSGSYASDDAREMAIAALRAAGRLP